MMFGYHNHLRSHNQVLILAMLNATNVNSCCILLSSAENKTTKKQETL